MRKQFALWAVENFSAEPKSIFLTGDLGFNALEEVASKMHARFINAGVAEQNMVSVAAGLAREGLVPLCYSIAPFTVFRPAEQIRLDVCLHKLNVKIVGNGGGYGYGIMGASHHAIEDIAVLSSFQGMKCFVPFCDEDVLTTCQQMMSHIGPSYLRLGSGSIPKEIEIPKFAPIRKLTSGAAITIVSMGPIVLNAIEAVKNLKMDADIFVVSEFPFQTPQELIESLNVTGKLLIVEEHVERGGLGESLALSLMRAGIKVSLEHACAQGYLSQRYGSQSFHRKESGPDSESLKNRVERIVRSKNA